MFCGFGASVCRLVHDWLFARTETGRCRQRRPLLSVQGDCMPRLKSLPPLLRREKPRLRMDDVEQERDRRRYQEQPWRKWYQSKEWLSLRRQAFERDGYICQRSGELCTGTGNEPNTAVANHKIPHHGDRALFFSLDNIETITKRIHDSLVQREEKSRT